MSLIVNDTDEPPDLTNIIKKLGQFMVPHILKLHKKTENSAIFPHFSNWCGNCFSNKNLIDVNGNYYCKKCSKNLPKYSHCCLCHKIENIKKHGCHFYCNSCIVRGTEIDDMRGCWIEDDHCCICNNHKDLIKLCMCGEICVKHCIKICSCCKMNIGKHKPKGG